MTIRSLSHLKYHDHSWAGPKACSLGWLMRHRYRVPCGFCIGADVYESHLRQCGAGEDDDRVARILQADIPTAHLEAITRAYQRLRASVVAVRSSATAEDLSGCSFAGQYETVLDVESLEQCLEAIKQCWASLWAERVRTYCRQNGIDHSVIKMAVIVQQQVEPDWAGVAFTAHPVNGSPSRIVIEACAGLGEKLVSGEVTPDRYVLRKKNLLLISQQLADEQEKERIPKKWIKQLARQARRLEKQMGHALDIEWALNEGRLYLLQARPVTTPPPPEKSWEDRQVWTNMNLGEVMPDVGSPMTQSMLRDLMDCMFSPICALLGAKVGSETPVAGWVAGRLYFNLTTGAAVVAPFWSWLPDDVDSDLLMGGHQEKWNQQGRFDIPDEDLPDLGFSWPRYVLSWPRLLLTLWRHRPQRAGDMQRRLLEYSDALAAYEPQGKSLSELLQAWEKHQAPDFASWDLIYLIVAGFAMPVLNWACSHWIAPDDAGLALKLMVAPGGMGDTQAGMDLWSLAELAHQDPHTQKVLSGNAAWSDIQPTLSATAHGQRWLQAWDKFMQEHGHHCRGEIEISNARWSEQLDVILAQVLGYLSHVDQIDIPARQQAKIAERDGLIQTCRQRLRNPIKRRLFNWALRQSQQLCRDRENWKNQCIRQIAARRRLLLALGDIMSQEGVLALRDDIFFLEKEEVRGVAQGQVDFDVKQRIAQRRDLYDTQCSYHHPHIIVGRFDPDKHQEPSPVSHTDVLHGIGSSPGIVTGPARVVFHSDDQVTVCPGEILVAPTTDPAWTPYFIPAAGVVIDQGGLLSHGSVIAREYGIPAVVNVPQASRIIQTGQRIRVDADQGIVTVLSKTE